MNNYIAIYMVVSISTLFYCCAELTEVTQCVGVARVGSPDQRICYGPLSSFTDLDMGPPLHSLVVVGTLHPLEQEFLLHVAESLEQIIHFIFIINNNRFFKTVVVHFQDLLIYFILGVFFGPRTAIYFIFYVVLATDCKIFIKRKLCILCPSIAQYLRSKWLLWLQSCFASSLGHKNLYLFTF